MLYLNLETMYSQAALGLEIPDDELNAGVTSQWKDPDKIRGQQASNRKKWGETVKKIASLDWRLGQIVAIGCIAVPTIYTDKAETKVWLDMPEAELLKAFWQYVGQFRKPLSWTEIGLGNIYQDEEAMACVAGFNIRNFDLPWLYGRSAVLGVKPSRVWQESRYSHHRIVDWADILSNYDPSRGRGWTLERYATWFQLPVERFGKGEQVPGWVEAGDWPSVERHLRSGLEAVRLLGEKFKHLI
jgi:hypothetical protein